jgi:hypothetical protein
MKFRWDQVQSHIWGKAQIFTPYMRRSLFIYGFGPDPSEFPNTYEENCIFFFINVGSEDTKKAGGVGGRGLLSIARHHIGPFKNLRTF